MKIRKLYRPTRAGFFGLFALVVLATSTLSIITLLRELRAEYENQGQSIVQNIADSSVDIILNRNLPTLQSLIDQFVEIESIRYIYILSEEGEYLAHTFVPGIPQEIRDANEATREATGSVSTTGSVERSIPGTGDFLEVGAPILSGEVGNVHVGMDLELLGQRSRRAVGDQIVLLCIVLIGGVFATVLFLKFTFGPLDLLLEQTVRMAHGDAPELSNELLGRKDEIGDIARMLVHISGSSLDDED